MTGQQIKAAQCVARALLDTIAEVAPHGAPSGLMYAALMAQGCTLAQYQSLVASMQRNGLITAQEDSHGEPVLLHITPKGQMLLHRFPQMV